MAGKSKIPLEIKNEIIRKAKEEGAKVSELATQYGVSEGRIYEWLKTGISPGASWTEINKLKRENQRLLLTIGFYAAKQIASTKKGLTLDNWYTT